MRYTSTRQNMSSCTEQPHVFQCSTAIFRWEVENFWFERLLKKEEEVIESPCFKHSNIDWILKLHRFPKEFELHLAPRQTKDLPLIFMCKFKCQVASTDECFHAETIAEPTIMVTYITEFQMIHNCADDGTLTVSCELTTKEPTNLQPKAETTASHKEKFFRGLSTLIKSIGSILNEAKFTDISLKVGEDTFQAHRAILAGRSQVFEGMFGSGMKESKEGVIEMTDMNPSTVKEMLQYIYTGEIETLSVVRAMDLYAAADRYDLQELRGWCKEFIVEHLSADEVCDLAVLADLHGDEELTQVAKKVFKQECKTMITSQACRKLAQDNLSVYMNLVEYTLINKN